MQLGCLLVKSHVFPHYGGNHFFQLYKFGLFCSLQKEVLCLDAVQENILTEYRERNNSMLNLSFFWTSKIKCIKNNNLLNLMSYIVWFMGNENRISTKRITPLGSTEDRELAHEMNQDPHESVLQVLEQKGVLQPTLDPPF